MKKNIEDSKISSDIRGGKPMEYSRDQVFCFSPKLDPALKTISQYNELREYLLSKAPAIIERFYREVEKDEEIWRLDGVEIEFFGKGVEIRFEKKCEKVWESSTAYKSIPLAVFFSEEEEDKFIKKQREEYEKYEEMRARRVEEQDRETYERLKQKYRW